MDGFLNSLHFNTFGVLGERKAGTLARPSEAGLGGLIDAVGPFIPTEEDPEASPLRLNAGSIKTLLEEKVGSHLKFNDLSRQLEFCGEMLPPDEAELSYVDIQQQGRICEQKPWLDALVRVAQQHRFDPVRDYLLNLEQAQGGEPVNLNSLATEYLGTGSELSNQMLKVAVLGAVWRRMDPGCQFDSVVVLKGAQGIRKSTFWRVLASPEWFCDTTPKDIKDLVLNVHSCWMFELAELESVTSRTGVGVLKALITTPSDQIRMPYGKATEKKDRASIFVSSVNGDDFLNDHTGSRRFLVIPCPQKPERGEFIPIDKLLADRDRIWRAAVLAWRNGEKPMLRWESQAQSQQQNAEFSVEDPWGSRLDRWLAGIEKNVWLTEFDGQNDPSKPFTTTDALLATGVRDERSLDRKDEMRMADLLKARGFEKKQQRIDGSKARYWIRTKESEVPQPAVPTAAIDVGTAADEVGTDKNSCA
jgi:predicted P-loop ATPase